MAVPMQYPPSRRQYIHRIPAYLQTELPNKHSPLNGSWWALNADSKSTSISSGYGTPRVTHEDGYRRHLPPPHSSTSSSSACHARSASNSGRDTLIDGVTSGMKRPYNALNQHTGGVRPISQFYLPVPQRQFNGGRKYSANHLWPSGAMIEKQWQQQFLPRQLPQRQYDPHRHHHSHISSRDSFVHSHDNGRNHIHNASYNSSFRSFSSSATNASLIDDADDSLIQPVRPPSPVCTRPSKWKSESNLLGYNKFNLDVRTLDEESLQIYNEILDAAGLVASDDLKTRASRMGALDVEVDRSKVQEKHNSCQEMRHVIPSVDCAEIAAPRSFLKPLDRRRSKRSEQAHTPARMLPPRKPTDLWLCCPEEGSLEDPTVDSEEAGALAVLENVVNLNFLNPKPSRLATSVSKNKPIRIIHAYLGEKDPDWQQAHDLNRTSSPDTFSVVEIDSDDDDENGKTLPRPVLLDEFEEKLLDPLQALSIRTSDQSSGIYSELTPSGDIFSDIDD